MDELTTQPAVGMTGVDPAASLLQILQKIQQLQGQPVVPDNPLAQIGTALSGMASGIQGRPNPVLNQFAQQRQMDLSTLQQQAGIAGTMASLQHQKTQEDRLDREEKRRRQDTRINVAMKLMALDNPGAVRAGLEAIQKEGVLNLDPAVIGELANSGNAKTLRDRMDATLAALDAGVDPALVGVNTSGINLDALRKMPPEQRAMLKSPDAQDKLAQVQERKSKALVEGVKGEALKRIQMGQGTPLDYKVAGLADKTPDNVLAEILTDWTAGRPLTPARQQLLNQYMLRKQTEGLSGEAGLAMRAALGDKQAEAALAKMKKEDKHVTEVELYLKAGEIRIKQQQGYQPTLQEQALLNASEWMMERRQAKPMPQYLEGRFNSMRTILDQVSILESVKNPEQYLGPVAGKWGRAAEAVGLSHDPERAKLHTALDTLFAEVGPQKFGGQFTGPEQEIVRAFVAESANPSKLFMQRLNSFKAMMQRKYKDSVSVAKASKYRLPEEFVDVPGQPDTGQLPKVKQWLLEGVPPEEIRRRLTEGK